MSAPRRRRPERDILGEDEAEFDVRLRQWLSQERPDLPLEGARDGVDGVGWIAPLDDDTLPAGLAPIANLSGLASPTLRYFTAPGWTGTRDRYADTQAQFGYTLGTRRRFMAEYGIDPLDIVERSHALHGIRWDVGRFPQSDDGDESETGDRRAAARLAAVEPDRAWDDFRKRSNRKLPAAVYTSLRQTNPRLPLFIDARLTPFGTLPEHSWFGGRDAADRLPDNPAGADDRDVVAAARRASKTAICFWGAPREDILGAAADTPASFNQQLADAAGAGVPPHWAGFALDLASLPIIDVLRLLTGLPVVDGGVTGRP